MLRILALIPGDIDRLAEAKDFLACDAFRVRAAGDDVPLCSIVVLGDCQWLVLSVMSSARRVAYAPIREATGRLENASDRMEERMITRQEMDWRQARSQEDRLRMESSIIDLRTNQIPRAEHELVWQNYDQQMQDKQRQLDAR